MAHPAFTPEEIQSKLSSNYNGEDEVYAYTGQDDIYINYIGGQSNLLNMNKSKRRMSFKIENKTANQSVIAISPASYRTLASALVYNDTTLKYKHPNGGGVLAAPAGAAEKDILTLYSSVAELVGAGHNIDTVLDDGIIFSDSDDPTKTVVVTATNKEASIRHFLEYIKSNPTAFVGMHISSDDETMYETELITKRCSPYKVDKEERLPFQDSFLPENQNTKKIIVKTGFQFDCETLAILTIPAGATVSITLVAGAVESSGIALQRKVEGANTGSMMPLVKPIVKTSLPALGSVRKY